MNSKKYFALAKENGIDVCELTLSKDTSLNFEIFKGEVISYSVELSKGISSRGIFNNKLGASFTEKDDKDTYMFLINAIKDSASLSETLDEAIIFKGSEKYKKKSTFSKKLAAWTVDEKLKICHEIEKKLIAADSRISDVEVMYSDSSSESEIINTYGLHLKSKSNYFTIYASIVVKEGTEIKSYYDLIFDNDPAKIDVDKFVKDIVEAGLRKLHGESIKAGSYKGVLSRNCVSSLLNAALSSAIAESVQKHTSVWEGKLNTKVFSEKLTIYEKPLANNFFYTYFDGEGVATYNKTVIEKGVLKTYFYNLVTAKKDNVASTGNGTKNGSKVGTSFGNIFVKPGRLSEEELIKKIGNGVYISDISGLHAGLDANSGNFSLQAEGFHVVDGKLGSPLTLFTVSGNIFELFNSVIAVGNNLKLLPSATFVPSIAFKGLKISAE